MPQQWDCPHLSCDRCLQLYGERGEPGELVAKSVFFSRARSNKKSRPLRLLFSKYPGICTACKGELNLVRKIEYINKAIYEVYLHRQGLFARRLVCASRANLKTDYWIETLSYIDAHIIVKEHLSPPGFLKRSLLRKVLTVNGVTTHTPGKVTKSNDSIATPNISVITVQKYLKLATLGKMQKPKK